jgi:gamma-glutamyltranspeptidase/glutathione hydrolase
VIFTRAGLAGIAEAVARLRPLRGLGAAERALAIVAALVSHDLPGDTTNLCVVDRHGNACVVTTSLGLGSGDWLPGLDIHLNSMLGESELLVGPLEPGARMASMMAPTLAVDGEGLALAAGSAGGSRLRSALVQVLAGVLDEKLTPAAAIDRPRLHPAGTLVHAEGGVPDEALAALEARGYDVHRWPALHHYFGGTSAVGRTGAGADPRRSGLALTFADLGA